MKPACQVLSGWDGRYDVETSGAVLFREFMTRYNRGHLRQAGALFGRPVLFNDESIQEDVQEERIVEGTRDYAD